MFEYQNRWLYEEHTDGGDLPGSDSPENTVGSDSQTTGEIDWKSRAEEAEKRAQNKAAAAKRQGEKIAKLEAQLAELSKSYQGDPESHEDESGKDWRKRVKDAEARLAEKHKAEVESLQGQLSEVLNKLQSREKSESLRSIAGEYVDSSKLDAFMRAYGGELKLVDGELETEDGIPAKSFIESLLEKESFWKAPPRKGIGITGESTGKGGIQKITLAEFNKLGDKARNEFAALVSEGKAKVV